MSIKVDKEGKRYHFYVSAKLDAHRDNLYRLLTNYDQIYELDDAIIESTSSKLCATQTQRVHTTSRDCIGFFCKTIEHLQSVESVSPSLILVQTVPAESDYSYGRMSWRLTTVREQPPLTRVEFSAVLEPDFWIPPMIGSYFLKKKFTRGLDKFFYRLEKRAQKRTSLVNSPPE